MILSSAKNCSVTSYITIFCFCFLAHYGALHHRKSLGRFLSSCCWPWMTSQGQPKMLLPYDHKIVIWILIYDFTEMMMITRQNVHLFKEKYTRKDFIFRAKKVPEKTDIILMPKIVVVLKMSDDDLSKYDKFSFVISSTNYSIKWDDFLGSKNVKKIQFIWGVITYLWYFSKFCGKVGVISWLLFHFI